MSQISEIKENLAVTNIGRGMIRREDPRLLTGQGKFIDDLPFSDFYEAAILRSPHAHARVVSIDTQRALKLSGVIAIYSAADLEPIMKDLPPKVSHPKLNYQIRLPIVKEYANYVGEPIAVVVAENRYIAEDAVDLIEVEYETLPAVASTHAALRDGGPKVHIGSKSAAL